MLDPAFQGDRYTTEPEAGWRLRADVLQVLATRTPEAMRQQFPEPMDVESWLAQTWAYDRHNVGDTKIDGQPVFAGDPIRALRSIKAKALLMSGALELYNPQENAIEAAAASPDGRNMTIPPSSRATSRPRQDSSRPISSSSTPLSAASSPTSRITGARRNRYFVRRRSPSRWRLSRRSPARRSVSLPHDHEVHRARPAIGERNTPHTQVIE
jgi:hypothetical protein